MGILLVGRNMEKFVFNCKDHINCYQVNDYTHVIIGDANEWRSLFFGITDTEGILDQIFELLLKANAIFRLKKEGDKWISK